MPWKSIKRSCKQKSTGKTGTHVVLKIKKGGGTERESCHTSDEKAKAAVRARYASKSEANENDALLREYIRNLLLLRSEHVQRSID